MLSLPLANMHDNVGIVVESRRNRAILSVAGFVE